MKRGSISNKQAVAIMFNLDNLLFVEPKQPTLLHRIVSLLDFNTTEAFKSINKEFKSTLYRLYHHSSYNILLATTQYTELSELNDYLRSNYVMFNRLIAFDNTLHIRHFVLEHSASIHYYVDTDEENLNILGGYAVHYDNMTKALKDGRA
jgi:hypothetical protein